ncbi:MAG: molecular chaperone [Gammaproteobacteria bacterium]|nr:MAG: molecular chaperone [Gammaproteobacteria bacterium]
MKTSDTSPSPARSLPYRRTRIPYPVVAVVALILSSAVVASVQAATNLMVTPTRVVFEQRDRTAQVTLVNRGSETGDFRISFIRQDMTEAGNFEPVPEDEDGLFADKMVRFSPRQVRLPPGQSQVIRLMLRKPRDLADGEYRSHMLFQALPPPTSSSVENVAKNLPEDEIKIELIPIVGVSIPVIVRHGKLDSEITLSDARILSNAAAEGSPAIAVTINRDGNRSAYGDLRATFTPSDGDPIVVAQANGVAVYANIDKRRFQMPLTIPEGFNLANGVFELAFIKPGSDPQTGTLAQTRFVLN